MCASAAGASDFLASAGLALRLWVTTDSLLFEARHICLVVQGSLALCRDSDLSEEVFGPIATS